MSINTLLENPASQSKPWCNLYVDSLTAYKDVNVKGNLITTGDFTVDDLTADEITANDIGANDLAVTNEITTFRMNVTGDIYLGGELFYETVLHNFSFVYDGVTYPTEAPGRIVRIGRQVTIFISQLIHTLSAGHQFMNTPDSAIPVQFRLPLATSLSIPVRNSGDTVLGFAGITNGSITIGVTKTGASDTFDAGSGGWDDFFLTYVIP